MTLFAQKRKEKKEKKRKKKLIIIRLPINNLFAF